MTVVAEAPAGRRRRAAVAWAVIGILVVAVGAAGATLASLGQVALRDALDPDSRAPEGARAVTEVLRDHGVTVEVERTLDGVRAALTDSEATLVFADSSLLEDDVLVELGDAAATVVVLSPASRTLDLLFDGSEPASAVATGTAAPDCALDVTSRAQDVDLGLLFEPGGDAVGCYPSGSGVGLLALGERRFAVDGGALLGNESLADVDNAALAVALLGAHDRLVWFVPSADDLALGGGETIADVTPDWVTPAIVLLVVAATVAMVWRGRRFGPLVAETLPVTVRATETTSGRAHLYARSGDALHAADELRIDALRHLARTLGLGPSASAPAIADAAAVRLGADRVAVRAVLLDDVPATDRDLVDLADRLRHLEAAVRAAVHPGRTTS